MAFVGIDTSTLVDHAVPGPCCGVYDMPLFVSSGPPPASGLKYKCVFNGFSGKNECIQDSAGVYPTMNECVYACLGALPGNAGPPGNAGTPILYYPAPLPCYTDMCCPCKCCRNSEVPQGFWIDVENMYYTTGACKIVNDGTYYAKMGYSHIISKGFGPDQDYYTGAEPCQAAVGDLRYDAGLNCITKDFAILISLNSAPFTPSNPIFGFNFEDSCRCVDLTAPAGQVTHDQFRFIPADGKIEYFGVPQTRVYYDYTGAKIDYSCNCHCTMYVLTNSEAGPSGSPSNIVTPVYGQDFGYPLIFMKPYDATCADWKSTYTASDFQSRAFSAVGTDGINRCAFLKNLDYKRWYVTAFDAGTNTYSVNYDYGFLPRHWFDHPTVPGGSPVSHGTRITITPDFTGGPLATCYPIMSAESASGIMSITGARSPMTSARRSLEVLRPDRCEYLGKRTEHLAGCNGWQCRHGCDLGLPAVPGGYCQGCESYAVDPDYAGKGPMGWLQ